MKLSYNINIINSLNNNICKKNSGYMRGTLIFTLHVHRHFLTRSHLSQQRPE